MLDEAIQVVLKVLTETHTYHSMNPPFLMGGIEPSKNRQKGGGMSVRLDKGVGYPEGGGMNGFWVYSLTF